MKKLETEPIFLFFFFLIKTLIVKGKCQPHKMTKHTQTILRLLPTNCFSVFDRFVGLALKGLTKIHQHFIHMNYFRGR